MVKKLAIILVLSYLTNSFAGVNIAFEKRDIDGLKQIAIVTDKSEFYTNSNELELYSTQKIGKFKINLKKVQKQINKIEKTQTQAYKKCPPRVVISCPIPKGSECSKKSNKTLPNCIYGNRKNRY